MAKKKPAKKRSSRKSSGRRGSRRSAPAQAAHEAADRIPEAAPQLDTEAALDALRTGEFRRELEHQLGVAAYAELRELALEAQASARRGGRKVFVLPGIMGSTLGKERWFPWNDVVWVDPLELGVGNGMRRLALPGGADLVALGPLLFTYARLILKLRAEGFDAHAFPYDWRRPVATNARLLAETLRQEDGLPAHLVCHSMGGLVARATWRELGEQAHAHIGRIVMLGTPNHGSFVPVDVLMGNAQTLKMLALLDVWNSPDDLVQDVIHTFPGLHELLPSPAKYQGVDLFDATVWPEGKQPRADVLASVAGTLPGLPASPGERGQWTIIAGHGQDTPFPRQDPFALDGLVDGDNTVPLDYALLEGVETFFVQESHGSLPSNTRVCSAVADLLQERDVGLDTRRPAERAGGVRRRDAADRQSPAFEGRTREAISESERRNVLAAFCAPMRASSVGEPPASPGVVEASLEPVVIGRRRQHRLDLRLAEGSITEVDSRAIVLGLFSGVAPAGPATVVDQQLEGAITEVTERRMFSGEVGEIFVLPTGQHRIFAETVVFVGMGKPGELTPEIIELVAENVLRTMVATKVNDFATVLVGSTSGASIDQSVASLARGFFRGLLDSDREHRFRSITLCESQPSRFKELRASLLRLSTTSLFDEIEVTLSEIQLPESPPMPRSSRPAVREEPSYLFVQEDPRRHRPDGRAGAESQRQKSRQLRLTLVPASQARSKASVLSEDQVVAVDDLEALLAQLKPRELRHLDFAKLESFGTDLGELVLPRSLRFALSSCRETALVVVHDAESSILPWETLRVDGWAPAAEKGLIRQYAAKNLSVAKWLEDRRWGAATDVLLVVNPTGDLPGTEDEAERLKEHFAGNSAVNVTELKGKAASYAALRKEFGSGKFDIIHYAGHAYFDPQDRAHSGILCHDHEVLSGADLAGLSRLPAFVFFNACESARVRGAGARAKSHPLEWRASTQAKQFEPRNGREVVERNVSLAEAFLRGGVASFLGTYWPVGDAAAAKFSGEFYDQLLGGATFGVALAKGRKKLVAGEERDWADYVYYGSPNFVLKHVRK